MSEHTLPALCRRSHEISKEKGWLDGAPRAMSLLTVLMASELSEALEDWREHRGLNEVYYEVVYNDITEGLQGGRISAEAYKKAVAEDPKVFASAKPCGVPIELADFVIRVCQQVGTDGDVLDLQEWFASTRLPLYPEVREDRPPTFDEMLAAAHYYTMQAWWHSYRKAPPEMSFAYALRVIFDFCSKNDIDLWAAIDEKEAFNRTRPHRHGGKKA